MQGNEDGVMLLKKYAKLVPPWIYSAFASALACCAFGAPVVAILTGACIGLVFIAKHMERTRE